MCKNNFMCLISKYTIIILIQNKKIGFFIIKVKLGL